VAARPFLISHKSIVVPEYCVGAHYHQCSTYVQPTGSPPRQLGFNASNVVDQSVALLHHYRSCYSARHTADECYRQLRRAFRDDTVLRYRRELIQNVKRVLNGWRLQE